MDAPPPLKSSIRGETGKGCGIQYNSSEEYPGFQVPVQVPHWVGFGAPLVEATHVTSCCLVSAKVCGKALLRSISLFVDRFRPVIWCGFARAFVVRFRPCVC